MMRAVDIIRKKRDGEALTPAEIAWMVAGIAAGDVADYQWSALLMAIVWRGMNEQRDGGADRRDDAVGIGGRPVGDSRAEDRQAQHRRRRRQDLADPGPDRRGGRRARCRWSRAAAWGTPAERSTSSSRFPDSGSTSTSTATRTVLERVRPGHDRPDRRDRAGRQVPLRPARRHGHRRVDPPDRRVDHVQEAGRGDRRPGPRRQDRRRGLHGRGWKTRVHAGRRRCARSAGAWARRWSP